MADVLHKATEGWFCPKIEDVCVECGKKFKRTDEHIFARRINDGPRRFYCSYSCFRVYERQKEAKKRAAEMGLDEEPKVLSEMEQAEKRVAQCHEKIAEYTQRKRRTTNKVRRDTAQKNINNWNKRLKEAEARLEALKEESDERKQNPGKPEKA